MSPTTLKLLDDTLNAAVRGKRKDFEVKLKTLCTVLDIDYKFYDEDTCWVALLPTEEIIGSVVNWGF